jgi:hypothetical protein
MSDLTKLNNQKEWFASSQSLSFGDLEYQPPKFVTPDSFERIPLNNVLKNNFWNGSYVAEWFDKDKSYFKPFLDKPELLQELSKEIQKYCPIALASVSDRLGNLVFQIPVIILMANFYPTQQENNFELKIAWHPKATPRPLRLNCEMEYDQLINGYFSCEIKDEITIVAMNYKDGLSKKVVWDDENKLILSATRPNSFIRSMAFSMRMIEGEPRAFKTKGQETRIIVVHEQKNSSIGSSNSKSQNLTQARLYKSEKEQLIETRKFVQYKPNPKEPNKSIGAEALNHIRDLIRQYGENSIWLWDPYLTADDVINTLLYCPFYGADLKAITALKKHEESNIKIQRIFSALYILHKHRLYSDIKNDSEIEKQRKIFNELESNFYGLKLEFRARIGNAGWDFHDRFLIFPDTPQGALAWSLGTSVNSLTEKYKKHHILQQVDDGQLIYDAFKELWDQLDKPENLLWKRP